MASRLADVNAAAHRDSSPSNGEIQVCTSISPRVHVLGLSPASHNFFVILHFPSALSFHIFFLLHVSSYFYVLSPFPQKISKSEYDEHKGKSLSFEVNMSPSRSLFVKQQL